MLCASLYSRGASLVSMFVFFFFSSRRRHTRSLRDWSSDVCSTDLSPSDRNQLWTPIQYFDNTGAPLGFALVNANTGTAVNASADHGGSAANTVPLASLNQWSTWTDRESVV